MEDDLKELRTLLHEHLVYQAEINARLTANYESSQALLHTISRECAHAREQVQDNRESIIHLEANSPTPSWRERGGLVAGGGLLGGILSWVSNLFT